MNGNHFPKAILHIDGDAFFASCELTKRPWLRGKPVVTGLEKGIASSMTYEAKAHGINRAMRISEMRRVCPDIVMLPSDYLLYAIYAERMYSIVRRYTDIVEEYSIDECFADITGMDKMYGMSYVDIAGRIKEELELELGITFSIGLSINKTLAKLASKYQKPNGFTVIPFGKIKDYISVTPVQKLWGIGRQTSAYIGTKGIKTAYDLASKDHTYILSNFDKPVQEMWAELNGYFVHNIEASNSDDHSSIQRTRTFHPPTRDGSFLLSQLSSHIEHTCSVLRQRGQSAGRFSFFIKTQEFRYLSLDFRLTVPSSIPSDFIKIINTNLDEIFVKGIDYRSSGVRMFDLTSTRQESLDLFGNNARNESLNQIFDVIDDISKRFGTDIMYLGSSTHKKTKICKTKKRFRIPVLGVVK